MLSCKLPQSGGADFLEALSLLVLFLLMVGSASSASSLFSPLPLSAPPLCQTRTQVLTRIPPPQVQSPRPLHRNTKTNQAFTTLPLVTLVTPLLLLVNLPLRHLLQEVHAEVLVLGVGEVLLPDGLDLLLAPEFGADPALIE